MADGEIADLRQRLALLREMGVESYDPQSGRVTFFPPRAEQPIPSRLPVNAGASRPPVVDPEAQLRQQVEQRLRVQYMSSGYHPSAADIDREVARIKASREATRQ